MADDTIKTIVEIEGGTVSNVQSTVDMEVMVINHDIGPADEGFNANASGSLNMMGMVPASEDVHDMWTAYQSTTDSTEGE